MSWLSKRTAYVEINQESSFFFEVTHGMVQGSVLGPFLFAVLMMDITTIEPITMFADDNYLTDGDTNIETLKLKLESKTNRLIKWLSDGGMKVNESKTELIIFSKKAKKITINANKHLITSKNKIKVLGVWFDNKLQWNDQITMITESARKLCFGLRKLQKYFKTNELLNIVTTIGFSKIYYGAPVWLSRNLHDINKRKLLRTSASLIKSCLGVGYWNQISFIDLHVMANKPTPMMMSNYYQATTMRNIFHNGIPSLVWYKMQMNVQVNNRNNKMTFNAGNYGSW